MVSSLNRDSAWRSRYRSVLRMPGPIVVAVAAAPRQIDAVNGRGNGTLVLSGQLGSDGKGADGSDGAEKPEIAYGRTSLTIARAVSLLGHDLQEQVRADRDLPG
jgi:hypothetical protein